MRIFVVLSKEIRVTKLGVSLAKASETLATVERCVKRLDVSVNVPMLKSARAKRTCHA